MAAIAKEEELYRSCLILFGDDLKVSREFLEYLQLSGIKKAYRSKALEFHPDRGVCLDLGQQKGLVRQFIDVHEAYKNLAAFLEARDKGHDLPAYSKTYAHHPEEEKKEKSRHAHQEGKGMFGQEKAKDFRGSKFNGRQLRTRFHAPPLDPESLYLGPIPKCPLLFGRFLYYSGIISLHTIGQALIWQRSQRPRLGEIGRRLGWLSEHDTLKILQHRRDGRLFGELALRYGMLSREQLHNMLQQQKKFHKRIGQYFVANNYCNAVKLGEYIAAHRRHNSRVR